MIDQTDEDTLDALEKRTDFSIEERTATWPTCVLGPPD
jgi:hypothetical protein